MLTAQKIVVEELFNGLAPDWRHWLIDSFDHMHVHDEDDHWRHVPGTLMYWPLAIEASIYIVNRTPQQVFFTIHLLVVILLFYRALALILQTIHLSHSPIKGIHSSLWKAYPNHHKSKVGNCFDIELLRAPSPSV